MRTLTSAGSNLVTIEEGNVKHSDHAAEVPLRGLKRVVKAEAAKLAENMRGKRVLHKLGGEAVADRDLMRKTLRFVTCERQKHNRGGIPAQMAGTFGGTRTLLDMHKLGARLLGTTVSGSPQHPLDPNYNHSHPPPHPHTADTADPGHGVCSVPSWRSGLRHSQQPHHLCLLHREPASECVSLLAVRPYPLGMLRPDLQSLPGCQVSSLPKLLDMTFFGS
jgi:hypothetical protein